jgi:S-DNA-T family DNA segregation ATPase FtsK/SpoIIIE
MRIPQVPQDLAYESFRNYPETAQAVRSGLIPLGYDLREATQLSIQPDSIFCYIISGGARSGKTNAMRLIAAQSAACGHDVCLIDNASGQLHSLAQENGIKYINTADQIYEWLSQTIVPEFKRRNNKIKDAGGRKFCAQAMADERQIIVLIHDFGSFLTTIYSDTRDMHTFLDAMTKAGNGHKIALFAAVSREDSTSHGSRPIYTGFISWKEGLHLGGHIDDQRIFDFEIPYSERSKKLPAGQGHTNQNGKTVTIIMPEV